MVKRLLVASALSLSALMSGCATVQSEYQCLDCEPQAVHVQTEYIPNCPHAVEVVKYIPSCSSCTYPVTIRSQAQSCCADPQAPACKGR
ncbi:hypothetical protein [Thiomicrospira microaerophila]|uniref:hypothetical protein n=1 Tax=Thiomicrospira microaerophila TaxID=406020 RepID=UPI0005C81207|nr:hypothetical protein [Thiomicrospira microaerophila]